MIAGKLIDIAWDAFSGPVKAYIGQLFKVKDPDAQDRTLALKHSDGIAVGVAIGYFHNFLKPLDAAIAQDRLLVFTSEIKKIENKDLLTPAIIAAIGEDVARQLSEQKVEKHSLLGSYDADHFNFSIVYPQRLENQNFGRVNDYLRKSTQKGSYFNRPNARPYGINYKIAEDNSIHIYDYARPIEAVWQYYRNDKNLSQDDIEHIQFEEIQLFLAVIQRLVRDNTRHLFNNAELFPVK